MALLANINRDPKKGRAFSPSDFNPFIEKQTPTLSRDELNSLLGRLTRKPKQEKYP